MLSLPKIEDPRGNLTFIESGARGACPFEIERVYWIYDVPAGRIRHGRALASTGEMIVAASGSFDVHLIDIRGVKRSFHLNRGNQAVIVEPGTWREIDNFSTNSVALVLASSLYDENEYSFDGPCASVDPHAVPPLASKMGKISHEKSTVDDAHIMQLVRHRHENGSLTVAENCGQQPFAVRRVFYLYDVPADTFRGGHSHHEAEEMIVALTGSFDVVLDDGKNPKRRFTLNRPYQALYIPTGIWRTLDNFSGSSISMVLTSRRYEESDYVRDYQEFLRLTNPKS